VVILVFTVLLLPCLKLSLLYDLGFSFFALQFRIGLDWIHLAVRAFYFHGERCRFIAMVRGWNLCMFVCGCVLVQQSMPKGGQLEIF